jgi:predicted transcriptional regulator
MLDLLPLTTFIDEEPVRIEPESHVFEAANVFRAHPQDTLPVVDPDGSYYGVLQRRDVLACLSHMLATHKQGAVLVIEMPSRDYTLGQLVYIIEQNNAKILSISSEIEELEGGSARITLKVNVADATRIRHVLGHYGYHVIEYFDTSTTADLQLRVQALMRYLEV